MNGMKEEVNVSQEDIEGIVIASSVIIYLFKNGEAITATRSNEAIKQAKRQAEKYSFKLYRE